MSFLSGALISTPPAVISRSPSWQSRERGVVLARDRLARQVGHAVLTVEPVLDQDSSCRGARPAAAGPHGVQSRQHARGEIHRDLLGAGFLHVKKSTARYGY